jgi:hypothetical protein
MRNGDPVMLEINHQALGREARCSQYSIGTVHDGARDHQQGLILDRDVARLQSIHCHEGHLG